MLLAAGLALAETGDNRQPAEPLLANAQLQPQPGLLVRWDPARSWGSSLLVDTMTDVSERLAWLIPDADPLLVGDISRRGGGWLFGHKTHHLGVDADVGIFTTGGRQPMSGFKSVHPDDVDLEATWLLIRELVDTGTVHFMLLDQRHIDALRDYLIEEHGMAPEHVDPIFPIPDRTIPWSERGIVRHAPNHSSHLHVRITREAPGADP